MPLKSTIKTAATAVVTLAAAAILTACSSAPEPETKKSGTIEVVVKPGVPFKMTWTAMEQIPRHQVAVADTPEKAFAVASYAKWPGGSVAAKTMPDIWLRIVESNDHAWLVSESTSGTNPDPMSLRREVVQRSGCIANSAHIAKTAMVFVLDCD